MKILPPGKYALAFPSLRNVRIHNLFAWSVIERHVSGKVYVADLKSPGIFYVVHPYGMSLLFGDFREDFVHHQLKDYLLNKNKIRRETEWLQVYPVEWENQIDAMLKDKLVVADKKVDQLIPAEKGINAGVIKHTRLNFRFIHSKFESQKESLTGNYQIVKTGDRLFSEIDGSVVPKKFWDNEKDFARRAVGFTLIKSGGWVATAFSSFIHGDQLDLGVETKPDYRKQGYSRHVCTRLIDHCLEHGYEPLWACSSGNLGSYHLARKLGFEPVRHLPYYELKV